MARTVQLTVASERTAALLEELDELEPHTLRVHRGASLRPPGDLVSLEVSNERLGQVMRVADRHGLGEANGIALSTAEPLSLVSHGYTALSREEGGTTWEELELAMSQDSTMTGDRLVVMLIAGAIAGLGIVSGTVHVVVGAMIIAPGFQPFARLVLGIVNRSRTWAGGLQDVISAYGAVVLGSAVVAVASSMLGHSALDSGGESYLGADQLVAYWSTTTWVGIAVGAIAAVCGGLLLAINRTVLTAGVMVALALVPTAALVPMALIARDPGLAGRAGLRFLIEVGLVVLGSALVFGFKRHQDRRSMAE
ncbi:MAG: DUF389 domain-containing protein [Nitriliruptor sp.]